MIVVIRCGSGGTTFGGRLTAEIFLSATGRTGPVRIWPPAFGKLFADVVYGARS